FERRAARTRARVGHFDERMTLPLRLGLEPQPTQDIVAGELDAIVGQLALGSALLAGLGTLGLEQLELAAVARVAQRRAAARASGSSSGITLTPPPRASEPYSTLAGPRITSSRWASRASTDGPSSSLQE